MPGTTATSSPTPCTLWSEWDTAMGQEWQWARGSPQGLHQQIFIGARPGGQVLGAWHGVAGVKLP